MFSLLPLHFFAQRTFCLKNQLATTTPRHDNVTSLQLMMNHYWQKQSDRESVCSKGLGDEKHVFLVIVCVFLLYVCSSTPWLRCGFRRHQRWTPVSSITAAHSWATCLTSEIWCWGEREVSEDDVMSRGLWASGFTFTFVLCRFDFANSNINDDNLNKMNPHHVPDVVRPSVTSGNCRKQGHQKLPAWLTLTSSGNTNCGLWT